MKHPTPPQETRRPLSRIRGAMLIEGLWMHLVDMRRAHRWTFRCGSCGAMSDVLARSTVIVRCGCGCILTAKKMDGDPVDLTGG